MAESARGQHTCSMDIDMNTTAVDMKLEVDIIPVSDAWYASYIAASRP